MMLPPELETVLKETIETRFHLPVQVLDHLDAPEDAALPIHVDGRLWGWLRFPALPPEPVCAAIQMFAQAALTLDRKNRRPEQIYREESALAARILSPEAALYHSDILAYGADLGYKLEHPMAIVVASLETNYNSCLNMNLGYESATNDAKHSILRQLKDHPYMNKQDMAAFTQSNCLVVLKAIEELNDLPRLYQMTDKLCQMVSDILRSYRIFRYYVAPGEIVPSFDDAHRAFREAWEHLTFARKMDLDHPVVTQDDILYHAVTTHLPKKLRVEQVDPKVDLLLSQNREMVEGLIQSFDAFVNNGFNITTTADAVYLHRNTVKKRMDKLRRLTGFDPFGDFKDVLMIQLILRQYLAQSREAAYV